MEEIFLKLTEYPLALKGGLESTSEASERPLLTGRLAAAAEIYALLHQSGEASDVHELVQSEIRVHGWSFISGQTREVIAKKWMAFTSAQVSNSETHNKFRQHRPRYVNKEG